MHTLGMRSLVSKSPVIARQLGGRTGGFDPVVPSASTLDRIAERQVSGGYVLKRSNLCPTCREYRAVNGTCGC